MQYDAAPLVHQCPKARPTQINGKVIGRDARMGIIANPPTVADRQPHNAVNVKTQLGVRIAGGGGTGQQRVAMNGHIWIGSDRAARLAVRAPPIY